MVVGSEIEQWGDVRMGSMVWRKVLVCSGIGWVVIK